MFFYETVKSYNQRFVANDDGEPMTAEQAGAALVKMAHDYRDKNGGSFADAFSHCKSTQTGLALINQYGAQSALAAIRGPTTERCDDDTSASDAVHKLAVAKMNQDSEMAYPQAVQEVLDEDTALFLAYTKETS